MRADVAATNQPAWLTQSLGFVATLGAAVGRSAKIVAALLTETFAPKFQYLNGGDSGHSFD